MKFAVAVTAFAAVLFGFTSQVAAFTLSPPSTKFTAAGPITLMLPGFPPASCTGQASVSTKGDGTGKLTGFTAYGLYPCSTFVGLPSWGAKAISATQIQFSNVRFMFEGYTCGPDRIVATDDSNGRLTFDAVVNPGGCALSGTLQTTPPITIIP